MYLVIRSRPLEQGCGATCDCEDEDEDEEEDAEDDDAHCSGQRL